MRKFAACCVSSLSIFLLWNIDVKEDEKLTGAGNPKGAYRESLENLQTKGTARADRRQLKNCNTNPLYDSSSFKGADESAAIELKTELAYTDPVALSKILETDPYAGIAFFKMLSSCLVGTRTEGNVVKPMTEGCPQRDLFPLIRVHPIELLQKSSELGSIDAKLMYAINAPLVAQKLRDLNDRSSNEAASAILEIGERLGTEAAIAGNSEAYRYMSHAFESGAFGNVNLQLAYSFALPLSILGTSDDKLKIEGLAAKLNQKQRDNAQDLAYGCKGAPVSGIFANPFG